jgi:hypothetical protein
MADTISWILLVACIGLSIAAFSAVREKWPRLPIVVVAAITLIVFGGSGLGMEIAWRLTGFPPWGVWLDRILSITNFDSYLDSYLDPYFPGMNAFRLQNTLRRSY